ncbi:MAG: response regulator [Chitinispirillaceae bacterium]|nr:response regulator [Chitinispirillaceae bacterium]
MSSILIVDDEYTIRMMLSDFLENRYEVVSAENAEQALFQLSKQPFNLVISDINMPGMSGIELLRIIRKQYQGIKTALITAYNTDEYIKMIKQDGISNIIPKTIPFNFTELDAIVSGLVSGAIFGLERYLLPMHTILSSQRITSSAEAREAREQTAILFARKFGTAGDMKLVLDEIITNAIYHAPATENGGRKYPVFTDITLQPDEHIELTCGYDHEKYGVSVVDRKGRLRKETVLSKIERQISGRGILDDSGRGIHMSRVFADRMIINIDPGKMTEVIVMNYFSPTFRGYKPLYINEL